jgi:hypothetical protein
VVAGLRIGRNCIAVGSAALKMYAQRSIASRLVEEDSEVAGDEEVEEETENEN